MKKTEKPVESANMNIRLSVSTASLNEVVVVGYGTSRNKSLTALQGTVSGIQVQQASVPTSSIPLQVEVQQSPTTVQFEVNEPYTISSDGKQLAVELITHKLKADYRYFAVPKLSENAYLTAAVTGISELNLMSGEANVFFEGAYLGKTLIDVQNTSDTLSISLGIDKNVIVKRIQQNDLNDKSFMGAGKRATRAFTFEVLNRKSVPLKLSLEDQIPVSNSSEVTVEKLELSGAALNESTGALNWDLQLKPNEKKEIKMKYLVKYPKNKPVRLE